MKKLLTWDKYLVKGVVTELLIILNILRCLFNCLV